MSSLKHYGVVVMLGACAAMACERKQAPTEAVVTQPAEEAKPQQTPEQKLDQEVEELAAILEMPEDHTLTVESQINEDNLLAELEKLEKELVEEVKANPNLVLPTTANPSRVTGAQAPVGSKAAAPKTVELKSAAPKPAAK
jgi:hypothetical protein